MCGQPRWQDRVVCCSSVIFKGAWHGAQEGLIIPQSPGQGQNHCRAWGPGPALTARFRHQPLPHRPDLSSRPPPRACPQRRGQDQRRAIRAPGFLGLCGLSGVVWSVTNPDSKARWEQVRGSRGSVARGRTKRRESQGLGGVPPWFPSPGLPKDSFSRLHIHLCLAALAGYQP